MPRSAGKCSRCLVPADGRRQPRRGTAVSLTTESLRPCLAERGIATLGDFLDTRATSRRRTRQMIRSVMSVNSNFTAARMPPQRSQRRRNVLFLNRIARGIAHVCINSLRVCTEIPRLTVSPHVERERERVRQSARGETRRPARQATRVTRNVALRRVLRARLRTRELTRLATRL